MEYTKEDIEKLIAEVEWELEGFERPTADNSKKMLEALKQTVKLFAVPVVTKRNWFERLPLHWRYLYYMVGGVIIGLLLPYVW